MEMDLITLFVCAFALYLVYGIVQSFKTMSKDLKDLKEKCFQKTVAPVPSPVESSATAAKGAVLTALKSLEKLAAPPS